MIPAGAAMGDADVLLLVEDDDALRETWAGLLAQEGLEVRSAADAASALREGARAPRPTLALLDR